MARARAHRRDDRLGHLHVDRLAIPPAHRHLRLLADVVGLVDKRPRHPLLLVRLHVHEHHVVAVVVRVLQRCSRGERVQAGEARNATAHTWQSSLSTCASTKFSPALHVLSSVFPVSRFFSVERTNAGPLPGFTWRKLMIFHTDPSSSIVMPFLKSAVEPMDTAELRLVCGGSRDCGDTKPERAAPSANMYDCDTKQESAAGECSRRVQQEQSRTEGSVGGRAKRIYSDASARRQTLRSRACTASSSRPALRA